MSTRPVVHRIFAIAMTLILAAPESRAELAVWDQAEITAIAKDLELAAQGLYDSFGKSPVVSGESIKSQTYYQLRQSVRVIHVEARALARCLELGETREQTLPIYDHLTQRVRIARSDAARVFNTREVGEQAAVVRGVLNRLGPYYDPDFQALAPHPNIEPAPKR